MLFLFSLTGNQGNFWHSDFAYVSNTKKNFQVVIEGKRGTSYRGDISIDDVSFSGDCVVDSTATLDPRPITPSPPPGCPSGKFSCNDGTCISADDVCNFKEDCDNGYDESSCPRSCDYEDGSTCKWRNEYYNDLILNWVVHKGQVPSSGPSNDHTTGNGKLPIFIISSVSLCRNISN